MARELARALREAGAEVLMTRDEDIYIGLAERVDFANTQGCDLFISIHCNSTPRRNSASGTQTYYCTPQSLELAQAIHSTLQPYVGGPDGGVRRAQFKVIRLTTMPSVLLEIAYINHEGDASKLAEPLFRTGVGDVVRDGIALYFGE
jgi:N-acetylmuramoyl-L-alanine amidase